MSFLKTKLHGTTIVGTKGQVVIPASARRELRIKSGDSLIVVSRFGKFLGMLKSDDIGAVLDSFLKKIDSAVGPEKTKRELRAEAQRLFKRHK